MISPQLEPDQAIVGRLVTEARRLSQELGGVAKAADELDTISDERPDLLSTAAGTILHNFLADPSSTHPTNLLAVGLLLAAGADSEDVRRRAT